MAKTKAEKTSVASFLKTVDAARRDDCEAIVALMTRATGAKPVMYGKAIVGFGQRTLVYPNGRELDWFQIGFSPRKSDLTLYLAGGLDAQEAALKKLGKHTRGKGCLYLKRLADVDVTVLKAMLERAVRE
jgi:hypothetical protein